MSRMPSRCFRLDRPLCGTPVLATAAFMTALGPDEAPPLKPPSWNAPNSQPSGPGRHGTSAPDKPGKIACARYRFSFARWLHRHRSPRSGKAGRTTGTIQKQIRILTTDLHELTKPISWATARIHGCRGVSRDRDHRPKLQHRCLLHPAMSSQGRSVHRRLSHGLRTDDVVRTSGQHEHFPPDGGYPPDSGRRAAAAATPVAGFSRRGSWGSHAIVKRNATAPPPITVEWPLPSRYSGRTHRDRRTGRQTR